MSDKQRIVFRRTEAGGNFTLILALVSLSALTLNDAKDGYDADLDGEDVEVIEKVTDIRGKRNSAARADKLAEAHKALLWSDVDGIAKLIASADDDEDDGDAPDEDEDVESEDDEDEDDDSDAESEDDDDEDDDDAKAALVDLGYKTDDIGKMNAAARKEVAAKQLKPDWIQIKKGGDIRIFNSKIPKKHAPFWDPDGAKAATKKANAQKAAQKGEPKGFKLVAIHPSWHKDAAGNPSQKYVIGTHADKAECERVAKLWADADLGLTLTVEPFTRGKPQNNLWEQPGMPIASLIPGDDWVGDHLAPHLRAAGTTIEAYRKQYKYDGPIVVNRAAVGLARAHNAVRRSYAVRVGMFVAAVGGDSSGSIFQIKKVHTPAEDSSDPVTYDLSVVVTNAKAKDHTVDHATLLEQTQPITRWSGVAKSGGEQAAA